MEFRNQGRRSVSVWLDSHLEFSIISPFHSLNGLILVWYQICFNIYIYIWNYVSNLDAQHYIRPNAYLVLSAWFKGIAWLSYSLSWKYMENKNGRKPVHMCVSWKYKISLCNSWWLAWKFVPTLCSFLMDVVCCRILAVAPDSARSPVLSRARVASSRDTTHLTGLRTNRTHTHTHIQILLFFLILYLNVMFATHIE